MLGESVIDATSEFADADKVAEVLLKSGGFLVLGVAISHRSSRSSPWRSQSPGDVPLTVDPIWR